MEKLHEIHPRHLAPAWLSSKVRPACREDILRSTPRLDQS